MKKIMSYLLVLIMLIPCIVLADYKYNDGIKKTDEYIFTYSDYARYIKIKEGLPYGFNNGKAEVVSSFKSGGFITKPEYDITNSGPSTSWLAPGIEYWLIDKWRLDTKPTTGNDEETAGVRITEYVLSNAKVKGTGTMSNPWEFLDGFSIKIGTTDKTIGQISPEEGYEHVGAGEGTKEFILTYDNKFPIDTKACENAASAIGATFSITNGSSANTKKIIVSNVSKDFTCFINFGINCYAISLNNNGGTTTNGLHGKTIYYQYGKGWYENSTCKTPLLLSITAPTKEGYAYQGYKYKINDNEYGKVIINTSNKLAPGVKDPDVKTDTAYAHWTPITYTVNYDCNPGTGNIEPSTHTFDAAKNLNASNCTRTGYSFKGWSRTANSSTVEFGDKASVTNLANTQGATVTLYAVWKDEEAPTCTATKTGGINSEGGVTFSITCNDTGSGCTAASTYTKTGIKSNTTFTVYDNAGNSGTCSGAVTSFNCNGYDCNPHNCNPYYVACGSHTEQYNCRTTHDWCYQCVAWTNYTYDCPPCQRGCCRPWYCKLYSKCTGTQCAHESYVKCNEHTVCDTRTVTDYCTRYNTCYDTCYKTCYK